VVLLDGYTPPLLASFTILAFAHRSGNFSTETGLNLGNGEFFFPIYFGDTLTLVVI